MTDLQSLPLPLGRNGAIARRTANGITLDFPMARTPGVAACLGGFALLCGLMPALGLSALLPLDSSNASAMVSLALIGGFAAPFILASVVFALLAIYLMVNALRVEIDASGARSERRVFGYPRKARIISSADIADIEPRISARYQNVFSSTPRYTLVAKHRESRQHDVIVAEDLAGQALMIEVRALVNAALGIKFIQ